MSPRPSSEAPTAAEDRPGGPRRAPSQPRGRATVERILTATSELLDAEGPEGLTTTAIAERAGIAIGTLYQYFADADAVVDAYVQGQFEAFVDLVRTTLERERPADLGEVGVVLVDAFVAHYRARPGFRRLWFSTQFSARYAQQDRANDNLLAAETFAWCRRHGVLPEGDDEGLALDLTVAWTVADALVHLAFRMDPDGDDEVLDRLRRLLALGAGSAGLSSAVHPGV